MITLAMRMKMTNLGLPSSSILGKGGGAERWNWRAIIPFLPLASTTNTWPWRCGAFKLRCCLRFETRECLTETSSLWRKREFVGGRRRSAFRDIPTSIDTEKVNEWVSFSYLYHFFIFFNWINNCEENSHTRGGWRGTHHII